MGMNQTRRHWRAVGMLAWLAFGAAATVSADQTDISGPAGSYAFGSSVVALPNADPGYDLTKILQQRHTGAKQMVRYGEAFYVSLGFDKLPDTFWERSLLEKPKDRDVVCHASAWDVDFQKDVRIKACIEPTEEYVRTVHHELGHNYYQMACAG